jgi:NCAIR mutase (PurE)-related protein
VAQEIRLDFDRRRRTGMDEAVFAAGKSIEQLEAICAAADRNGAALFLTRLAADRLAALRAEYRERIHYCAISRTGVFEARPGAARAVRSAGAARGATVALVAGGSSDVPVLREAERTLDFHGVASRVFIDVGVAGLWRLTQQLPEIAACPVVIAVAGMEAALPTVLAGLIASSIIAVPTSIGYGVAAGGDAALHAILASCAPGLVAVNIDNGYGAACAALRVLQAGTTDFSSLHTTIGSTPSWNAAHSSNPPLPESV